MANRHILDSPTRTFDAQRTRNRNAACRTAGVLGCAGATFP
jgi:hypothetical protein